MKFLNDEALIKLKYPNTSQSYTQTILSETMMNEVTKTQRLDKTLSYDIDVFSDRLLKVTLNSKLNKLELPSLQKKQETLSAHVAKLMEDVELSVLKTGAIESIINHEAIVKKWQTIKQDIEQRYKGNSIDKYIVGMDKRIRNHDKLMLNFEHFSAFGFLWNGQYGVYDTMRFKKKARVFDNMVSNMPIVINEHITLQEIKGDIAILKIEGKLDEHQPYKEKIQDYFVDSGSKTKESLVLKTYSGHYSFDLITQSLLDCKLKTETAYGDFYNKSLTYTLNKNT